MSLWPKLRVLQVYGANTGVGKTIFSSLLCRAFKRRLPNVRYLKPVSTGPLQEADDRHIKSFGQPTTTMCLFQFDEAVSPHIAARSAGKLVTDEQVLSAVYKELREYANGQDGIAIVETAGGVLSPAPSGSSQADLYRPLRLPTLLVGDHNLGGIGMTISAWESLHIRGYDVSCVALFAEDRYGNHSYLRDYFRERQVNTFAIPPPPKRATTDDEDVSAMQRYYQRSSEFHELTSFTESFLQGHENRIKELRSMPEEADEAIWHPFMQHSERSKDTIVAWDSAYGDHFQAYRAAQDLLPSEDHAPGHEASLLKPAFDGSASWWTQGLGHGNPHLALTAANAAGRYGHVMFANAIHQPALRLAQTILRDSGNPRLAKVFYSDNGSTGMEVAVKMALRAAVNRHRRPQNPRGLDIRILGLKNSYHGDTIGTMDCSEPSIYNEKVEWYSGRGMWLDFPTVKMRKGHWEVEPYDSSPFTTRRFTSLTDIFDFAQRGEESRAYKQHIHQTLSECEDKVLGRDTILGALIIEPVLLGAGGMLFADPLYQKCLVEVAREFPDAPQMPSTTTLTPPPPPLPSNNNNNSGTDWQSMPVIFDEVFTGLYRLGRFSAASFLDVQPDIVVQAKLLTGGLLPLCTTSASQSIFEAFVSRDKTDALLHGHSYTAHPIGCAVANESLRTFATLERRGAWQQFQEDWNPPPAIPSHRQQQLQGEEGEDRKRIWSVWSHDFVTEISFRVSVDHVFALGTVLAVSLKDPGGGGYASTAAIGLRDALLRGGGGGGDADDAVIHSRVMGNVLYLMSALTTPVETLRGIENTLLTSLQ